MTKPAEVTQLVATIRTSHSKTMVPYSFPYDVEVSCAYLRHAVATVTQELLRAPVVSQSDLRNCTWEVRTFEAWV